MKNGKNRVIVSDTLIWEVVDTVRKRIPRMAGSSESFRGTDEAKKRHIEGVVWDIVVGFITTVGSYSKSGHVRLVQPDAPVYRHQGMILEKLKNYFGQVHITRKKRYEYKGLGYVDFEHAYLAKQAGASAFYTSDRSFNSLNNDRDFRPIEFIIVERRPDTG